LAVVIFCAGPRCLVVAELFLRQQGPWQLPVHIGRVEYAVAADVDRTLIVQLVFADLRLNLRRRSGVAVIPVERQAVCRGLGAGEDVLYLAIEAPAIGVGRAGLAADRERRRQRQRTEYRIENVATHVAKGAGAEVETLAPFAGVVVLGKKRP